MPIKSENIKEHRSMTANMRIDVDGVTGANIVDEIEFLRNIPSFSDDLYTGYIDKNQLVRYIVILYSDDSFLNKKIPIPLQERKEQLCKLLHIDINDEVRDFLFNLNDVVTLKMVQDFLIAQNHTLWTEISTTEQQYAEAIKLRLKPVEDGKDKDNLAAAELKKKLREECKVMVNDLEGYYRKLYQNHDDVRNQIRVKASSLESLAKSAKDV